MKTNLKLLLLLSIIMLSSCQENSTQESLTGTWQMYKNGQPFIMSVQGHYMHRYKIINDATFVVLQTFDNDSSFIAHFTGYYTLENDIYTENIMSTTPAYKSMVGSKATFKMELEEDFMHIVGIDNDYNEMWKKVSFEELTYSY